MRQMHIGKRLAFSFFLITLLSGAVMAGGIPQIQAAIQPLGGRVVSQLSRLRTVASSPALFKNLPSRSFVIKVTQTDSAFVARDAIGNFHMLIYQAGSKTGPASLHFSRVLGHSTGPGWSERLEAVLDPSEGAESYIHAGTQQEANQVITPLVGRGLSKRFREDMTFWLQHFEKNLRAAPRAF